MNPQIYELFLCLSWVHELFTIIILIVIFFLNVHRLLVVMVCICIFILGGRLFLINEML